MMSLIDDLLAGSRIALSRILTEIENGTPNGHQALDILFSFAGKAHLIGVTGAPGTGKSSLVNRLALTYRKPMDSQAKRVGIVAIDPSSPFSGGAILGDRVRMRDLAGDSGVFIRSMASRGALGGLAMATSGIVQAMDAAGFEIILIETVGAGQAEVDIARLAHTTIVVEAPGMGDDIQAFKAGIMEIADIFVINKADRPGVDATERALRSNLQLSQTYSQAYSTDSHTAAHHFLNVSSSRKSQETNGQIMQKTVWEPPIIRTVAVEGAGIDNLRHEISRHYEHLRDSDELVRRNRERLQVELELLIRDTLAARWRKHLPEQKYQQIIDRLVRREISPWKAVEILLEDRAQ